MKLIWHVPGARYSVPKWASKDDVKRVKAPLLP